MARCPKCHQGKVTNGLFRINKNCEKCSFNLYPEPGYYLGAMMVAYIITGMLAIPTIIGLKLAGYEPGVIIAVPLVQYLIMGPLIIHYSKVAWLHLECSMTHRLDGEKK